MKLKWKSLVSAEINEADNKTKPAELKSETEKV